MPAIVAAIRHVPLVEAVMVAVDEEFDSAQLVAVPPDVIAYVTVPGSIDPPEVDINKTWEYGYVFDVGVTDNSRTLWFARSPEEIEIVLTTFVAAR